MSTLRTIRHQLGISGTETNNFTITAESSNGTMKIAKGNAGATTQDILSIDSSNNVSLGSSTSAFMDASGNAISPMGCYKNNLINGNFDIWQRGTNFTVSGGVGFTNRYVYTSDRWMTFSVGSSQVISQQVFATGQSAVPNNPKYFSRHTVTAGTSVEDWSGVFTKLEDVTRLAGKTLTLSFWAKADSAKNIATSFLQYNNTAPLSSAFGVTTHALTTSWQKFTMTTTIPALSSGTTIVGANFTQLAFFFDSGSAGGDQTNNLPHQSGVFDIAQVQLEEGSIASPFEDRPVMIELKLCQRYYQTFPESYFIFRGTSTSAMASSSMNLPVNMRIAPTITIPAYTVLPAGTTISSISSSAISSASFIKMEATASSTLTAGNGYVFNFSSGLILDAEL